MIFNALSISGIILICAIGIIEGRKLWKIVNALQRNDRDLDNALQARTKEYKLRRETEKINAELANQNAELAKQNAELSHKIALMKQSDVLTFAGVNYLSHQYTARNSKGKTIITIIDTK